MCRFSWRLSACLGLWRPALHDLEHHDGLCGEGEAEEEESVRIEMKPGSEAMAVREVDAERVGLSFSFIGDFQ